MSDTTASRCLRSAYIQHLVSTTLCHRVFEPFLFLLGLSHQRSDDLFRTMSTDLRNKSFRKEAVWRQHTLSAAYTSQEAKATTNSMAGAVVKRIMNQISPFAHSRHLDIIHTAVKRIVKLAAETWRYARLEREMITARMPLARALREDARQDEDEWGCHEYNQFPTVKAVPVPRRPLLGLLPTIAREPGHESLRASNDDADHGRTYVRGIALHSDCVPILVRSQELQVGSAEDHDDQTEQSSAINRAAIRSSHPSPVRSSGAEVEDSGSEASNTGSEESEDEDSDDDDGDDDDEEA